MARLLFPPPFSLFLVRAASLPSALCRQAPAPLAGAARERRDGHEQPQVANGGPVVAVPRCQNNGRRADRVRLQGLACA